MISPHAVQVERELRRSSAKFENHLNQFERDDITSYKRDVAELAGIDFAGFRANR